jgi:hypothetical protein
MSKPVKDFPEFRRGQPVDLDELKRINELANRSDDPFRANINGPAMETDYDSGGVSMIVSPDVSIRAMITAQNGSAPQYDWVETQTVFNTGGLPVEGPKLGGLADTPGTFTAHERNNNGQVPIGSFIDLWLGDDGQTWFFTYAGPVPASDTFGSVTIGSASIGNATVGNITVTNSSLHLGPETYSSSVTLNGPTRITGGFYLPQGSASIPSGTTNNWNPGVTNGIVDIVPSGSSTITGYVPPSTPDGFLQTFYNDSTTTITLPNASGGSTAGNQFFAPGGVPVTINPGQTVQVKYSAAANGWLVFLPPTASSSSLTSATANQGSAYTILRNSLVNASTGLTLTLPGAGTYFVFATVSGTTTAPPAGDTDYFNIQMSSDSVWVWTHDPVGYSSQYGLGMTAVQWTETANNIIARTGADTMTLFAYCNNGAASGGQIFGGGSSPPTLIGYLKIG